MGIIDDIRMQYKRGGMLLRLVYINIGVFVLLHLVSLVKWMTGMPGDDWLLPWLAMPSSLSGFLHRPWTIVTYCFVHKELWHIIFNLLWLYGLGRIFLEYFTPKQLAGLYVLGGVAGGALFLLAYQFLPPLRGGAGLLMGASASVIAIVVAVGAYAPDYKIGLLFLGRISLKWVALVMVLLSVMSLYSNNPGGNIAHLGGALMGLWYAQAYRRGHDITRWLNTMLDRVWALFSRRQGGRGGVGQPVGGQAYRGNTSQGQNSASSQPTEEQLDRVLEKIKRSGYGALSDEERDLLFRASRKR